MKKATNIAIVLLFILLVLNSNAQDFPKINPTTFNGNKNTTALNSTAQSTGHHCGTVIMDSLYQASKGLDMWNQRHELEKWMSKAIEETKKKETTSRATIYTIPVIVHVIHNGESVGSGRNISQAQVNSQIDVLNEDFRKMLGTNGYNTNPVGADVEIEFCLALVDPNGNTLTQPGIDRVNRNTKGFSGTSYTMSYIDGTIKPATQWDPKKYMNIWTLEFGGSDASTLGYAQFPSAPVGGLTVYSGGAANTDGVVIGYTYFGRVGNVSAPYNLGRTSTHEVGHFLGLHHLWGDGGCTVDDYCNDTPNCSNPNYSCTNITQCSNTRMVQNYMDYTDDNCMNIFTVDQRYRMRTIMENSPRRLDLLSSNVCNTDPPTCAFSGSPQTIQENGSVTFTDNSTNTPTSWSWTISGGSPSSSTSQNPSATYSTAGVYDVTLIATNASGSCTLTESNYITVTAPPAPTCAFTPSATSIQEGGTVTYTDNSANNPTSWSWAFEGGSPSTSTSQNPTVTYATSGTYNVTFTATNSTGSCQLIQTNIVTITVPPAPVCNFSYSPAIPSEGNNVTFTDLSANTPTSWAWTFEGGSPTSSTSQNPVINYATGGTYGITLTATNGTGSCASTQTITVATSAHCDTLGYPYVGTPALYNTSGNEYMIGWNEYDDKSKAEYYANPSPYNVITGMLVWIGAVNDNGNGATVDFNIWNGSGASPGVILGTTTLNLSDINTTIVNNGVLQVDFFPHVTVTNNFYAGITMNGFGYRDSLGIITNTINDPATNGAWEQWSDNTWHSIPSAWSTGKMDAFFWPLVTDAPAQVNITTDKTIICEGAQINYNGIGSNNVVSYSWVLNGGSPSSSTSSSPTSTYTTAGIYKSYLVGDGYCSSYDYDSVQVTVTAPPTLVTTTNPASCTSNNGSVSVNTAGGTAPFTYNWSSGGSSATANNLTAGNYTVTVTDNSGCKVTANANVTATNTLSVSVNTTNSTCGNNNGTATANLTGAAAPVTYSWSTGGMGSSINSLGANVYSVTVTDNNGCTAIASGTVTNTAGPTASVTVTGETCGNANGTATAVVNGGTNPMSYAWSNGGNTSTINSLSANTYTVTVTDNNGCTISASNNISNIAGPTVNVTTTNATCGNNNGSATAVVSGGTGPMSYAWNNAGNTATINSLTASSYTVTVTDNNGCTATNNGTVSNTSGPSLSVTTTAATCGNNNGTATAIISGGTTPYSYNWSTGGSAMIENNLSAGTKSVTITDNNSCSISSNYIINNVQPTTSVSSTDATCGNSNGSISVNANGGTSPYTYNWSNGYTTSQGSNLAAGVYYISITDNSIPNCLNVESVTISNIAGPTAINTTITNETCSSANGAISTSISGGTGPYTYLWSNSSTTQNISGLSAAKYFITVTDNNGCKLSTSGTVQNLAAPTANVTVINATCGVNNGSATAVVSGGSSPLSYNWNTGASTTSINGLSAGTVTVTITDANSCSVTASNSISSGSGFTVTVVTSDATCGNNNGTATASSTGGNAPLSYSWSNGGSSFSQSNLSSGTISVTVTDNSGCVTTDNATIAAITPPSVNITTTDETCTASNGTLSAIVTNGTLPYTYSWNTGGNTATLTNQSAGSFSVTITDAYGCKANATNSISNQAGPAVNVTTTNATCGNNNGTATAIATGGTGTITYLWSNGGNTASLSNLSASAYTVTISDNNNCKATATGTVNSVSGPTATTTKTNETCSSSNGSATAVVSGGTGPFSYNWSNGGNTATISNIAAGSYSVTITDNNNCTTTASATLTNITGPSLTISKSNASCGTNNGSATAIVTGGTAPISYIWSTGSTTNSISSVPAANYYVTVTDGNSCVTTGTANIGNTGGPTLTSSKADEICGQMNGEVSTTVSGGTSPYTYSWSNGSTASAQTGLSQGNYSVTVTDNASCIATEVVNVGNISGPNASMNTTDESCGNSNGTATAVVSNGTSPYSYTWSNSATTSSINGLSAGGINLTVTDNNGCTASTSGTINNSAGASVSITNTSSTCGNINGSATATVSGGASPITYAWSSGANTASASNLAAGIYSVTVTDNNSCSTVVQTTVTNIAGATVSVVPSSEVCGQGNGSATALVSGGTAPYTYNWNNGATVANQTNLSAATYTVTVTDNNSCVSIASGTVSNTSGPSVSVSTTDASCGLANGSAQANVSGGTSPYNYNWSSGGSASIENNLNANTYTLTVTDVNNCTAVTTFGLSNNTPLATSAQTDATCGQANGSITITPSSGVSPYSYNWSNGASTAIVNGLTNGNYTVSVQDASGSGCVAIEIVSVANISGPSASITVTKETCNNSNGTATAIGTGGTGAYTYAWNTGATTQSIAGLAANGYNVTVTDNNNCSATASNNVTLAALPNVTATSSSSSCGNADGSATANGFGSVGPYTYMWSNTATTSSINNVNAGNYGVTVTDGNGCTVNTSVSITDIGAPTLSITATDEICSQSNGSATAIVSGGVSPYTYNWSNGGNSSVINGISQNTYGLTVTDMNNCTAANSVVVSMISGPSATVSVVDATCGSSNGRVTVNITNGTAPYSTVWSTGSNTNLSAGNYNVSVTDNNGCLVVEPFTVNNASGPVATVSVNNATCGVNNGDATVTLTGGAIPFTYNWSNGGNAATTTGLVAGGVSVTVTDANSCTTSASGFVNNDIPSVTVTASSDASCGLANGSASVNVSGGATPYSYSWSSGATTAFINGVTSGVYQVTIVDNNSCVSEQNITIGDTPVASLNITSTQATCGQANADAIVIINGGTAPYSINWNNGATTANISSVVAGSYSVSVTDANMCQSTGFIFISNTTPVLSTSSSTATCGNSNGSASVSASGGIIPYTYNWSNGGTNSIETNLVGGIYTVTVSDASGCVAAANVTVNDISGPSVSYNAFDANCGANDGVIQLNITGGSSPYTYLWSSGGTSSVETGLASGSYSVVVNDATGCSVLTNNININNVGGPTISIAGTDASCGVKNGSALLTINGGTSPYDIHWSSGSTSISTTGLGAGTYSATVIDDNLCVATSNVTISASNSPVITINAPTMLCENDSTDISVSVTGGQSPYEYLWNNGASTSTLTSQVSGIYFVTVSDMSGCNIVKSTTITTVSLPSTSITSKDENCSAKDGLAEVTVLSGTSPYLYVWSNGANTYNATNLAGGEYYVSVADANGCITVDTVTINNIKPVLLITATNTTCNQDNGQIIAGVTGGVAPFSFNWSSGETSAIVQNASKGSYLVSVTDFTGCVVVGSAVVGDDGGPTATINSVDPHCGIINGSATAVGTGGRTPYTYNWSNGGNTQTIDNLDEGFYSLILKDASGCNTTASVELVKYDGPTIELQVDDASCGEANGEISVIRSGGTPPITYTWSNGGNSFYLSDLEEGDYVVTVSDANNCAVIDTASVGSTDELCMTIPTGFTPNGDGTNDVWNLKGWEYYGDIKVEVYNRWGTLLYSSNGYSNPWDGTYNGDAMPSAVYYFVITIESESFTKTGTVTIRK